MKNTESPNNGKTRRKPTRFEQGDVGNAKRFSERYRDELAWCAESKNWFHWNGKRWEIAVPEEVLRRAMEFAQSQLQAAIRGRNRSDRRHAVQSMQRTRLTAVTQLAQSCLRVDSKLFDNSPMLFNCPNGTIDLRTGRKRIHCRDEYLTQMCPTRFDADAECPKFLRFLEQTFDGDSEVIGFLQRFLGYCLTGQTSEQVMVFFIGSGANGKSTLVNVLQSVMGSDYCIQAEPTMLTVKQQDAHSTEKMDLKNVRLGACSETQRGRYLDEAKVKLLTGSDRIRARKLYQDFEEFTPTHKFILQSNHFPQIAGTDDGIWRRIIPVHFRQTIAPNRRDPSLFEQLCAESTGILAWLIKGCVLWQNGGLAIPETLKRETSTLRESSDSIGCFLRDCCRVSPTKETLFADLYAAFVNWCQSEGNQSIGKRELVTSLLERGYEKKKSNGVRIRGIELQLP